MKTMMVVDDNDDDTDCGVGDGNKDENDENNDNIQTERWRRNVGCPNAFFFSSIAYRETPVALTNIAILRREDRLP